MYVRGAIFVEATPLLTRSTLMSLKCHGAMDITKKMVQGNLPTEKKTRPHKNASTITISIATHTPPMLLQIIK